MCVCLHVMFCPEPCVSKLQASQTCVPEYCDVCFLCMTTDSVVVVKVRRGDMDPSLSSSAARVHIARLPH